MKVIVLFALLISVVSARANVCRSLFKEDMDPRKLPISQLQHTLNSIDPTTRDFDLMGEKLKLGDLVVIQMTPDAFYREALPLLRKRLSSNAEILEARMLSIVDGIVVGSVIKADRETKQDQIHIAILDPNISEVFFVSKNMIEAEGESYIAGHKYNQLKKDPALELDESVKYIPSMDSTHIH